MCDCLKEAIGYLFVGALLLGTIGIGTWIGWVVRGDFDAEKEKERDKKA